MITDTLSALIKPTKGMLEPIQKLNQEAVATVEKVAARQIDSLKAYSDLGVSQLRVAAEVKDREGIQKLLSKQTEVLRAVGECLMSDFRAIFEIGAGYASQAKKIGVGATPPLSAKTVARAD